MTKGYWGIQHVTGAVLVIGMLITIAGVIVVVIQGKIEGLEAAFKGVEGIGEDAAAFRTVGAFSLAGLTLMLVGFGMFTVHLAETGDRGISIVALNLLVFTFVFAAVEGTFHSEVTAWAGEEWARTGATPEFYEPLRRWMNGPIQLAYMTFGFASMAGYGWAMLRTMVIPRWVGWATIGWSLAWLTVILVTQDSLPAVLFVPQLLIGVALLVYPSLRASDA